MNNHETVPEIKNDYGPTDMLNGNINLVIGSFLKMIIYLQQTSIYNFKKRIYVVDFK